MPSLGDGMDESSASLPEILHGKFKQLELSDSRNKQLIRLQEKLLAPGSLEEKANLITCAVVDILDANFARLWHIRSCDRHQDASKHGRCKGVEQVCQHPVECLHLIASSGRSAHINSEIHSRIPLSAYQIGRIISLKEAGFFTNDFLNDPLAKDSTWAENLGLVSFAGYRLTGIDGMPIGILALFSTHILQTDDIRFLESMANTASHAIQAIAAQSAYMDSREQYRAIYNNAPIGLFRTRLSDGKFLMANDAMARMMGYRDEKELLENDAFISDFYPQDDRQDLVSSLLEHGEVKRHELRFELPDGRIVYSELSAFTSTDKQYIEGAIVDITDRKNAEEQRLASEQRFSWAMETTSDGFWDFNPSSQKINYFSPRWFRMLGFEPNELPSEYDTWLNLLHPDDVENTVAKLNAFLKGEAGEFTPTFRLKAKNGGYRWIYTRGMITERDEHGNPTRMIGTHVDVTQLKQYEEDLARERNLFILGPTVVFNWRSHEDWPVEYVSANVHEQFGYNPEDFTENRVSYRDIVHPDDRERIAEEIINHNEAGADYFEQEYRIRNKAGDYRWVYDLTSIIRNQTGKITHHYGYIIDITERKEAEFRLAAAFLENEQLFNTVSTGIRMIDLEFNITRANKALSRMCGIPVDEIVGKKCYEILPGDTCHGPYCPMQQLLNGKPQATGEYSFQRADGRNITCEFTSKPFRDTGGNLVGILEDIRDITERRQAEINLLNTLEELATSNQELDDFAYIASHDLKEPLRGISNYAQFLMEDYRDVLDEEGVRMLETLPRLTSRLERQINDLLTFSRVGRQELSWSNTDLNKVVSEVIDSLKIRLDELGVKVRVATELPILKCDAARIRLVFLNLISNAMKYNDKPDKWIEIGRTSGEQDIPVIYVSDNGIGIPENHQDKIFKMFKRLHTRDKFGGGTGAGMTIAKKIIERHQGRIWLESVVGQGTTFYFTLNQGMAYGR